MACGRRPMSATGRLCRRYAQLLAVEEQSQKRCWLRASISRVGTVRPMAAMEVLDVQYSMKTSDLDVAQVGSIVRHDALSMSSHLSDV